MRGKRETSGHVLQFGFGSSAPSPSGADQRRFAALAGIIVSLSAIAGCGGGNHSNPVQSGTPALKAAVAAQGNFSSGQTNASYTITVSNTGNGATSGTVTVADPPTGFTIAAISGPGWGGCTPASPTCTRGDSLGAGQSFPPITVTGNVTAANGTPVTIPVTVSGGGTSAPVNVTPTPTVTVAAPSLSVSKTHAGNFTAGQQGATYSVTVQNGASAGATNAKVTVTETVPTGETLVSMSGNGWTCPGAGGANTCDRSDALSSGASYPALSVTVNVAANATSPQVNQVSVSGGGISGSASANDSTTIVTPPIGVSISPTNPTVTVDATDQFIATVTNDSTAAGVTFTLTQSGVACSPACGTINPASSAGNSPTTTYSAPAIVLAAPVTLTATSGADPTKSTSTTLTVAEETSCASKGVESLLNGPYAFLLKGFDSSGNPALIGGVLTFNGTDHNGLITAGAIDTNLNSGVQLDLAVTSGSYGVGTDQRGCMVITTSAGTQNYRFSLGDISSGVSSTGHVIGFDQGGPFTTGVLRKQSGSFSNSTLNGSYAFGGSSVQNSAKGGGKFALVGVVSFDGNGNVTGGSQDFDNNGTLDGNAANTTWPASPIAFTGGAYSVSANGRATLAITSAAGTGNNVLYLVSASEALLMTSDPQTTGSIVAGEALQQSGAPFSANPLTGTYIGYDSGLGGTGAGRTDIFLAGPLTLGSNSLNVTQQRNDGGTFTSTPFSGTYSVNNSGRMIYTPSAGHAPVLYLVSSSQAFWLIGNGSVDSGFFQSQSGSPFSNSSANGTYAFGAIDPENLNGADTSGVATFTPATGSSSQTYDGNQSGGTPGLDHMQSFTYSIDTTGLAMIPSGCSISVKPTTCQQLFYVISPMKAIFMNTQSSNPKLYLVDQ